MFVKQRACVTPVVLQTRNFRHDGFNLILTFWYFHRQEKGMIAKMKQSGLGYHVAADDTKERLGEYFFKTFQTNIHQGRS